MSRSSRRQRDRQLDISSGGQIYRYVEDAASNLLCVTGTKLYPIEQPEATFKLDSSLVFTLVAHPAHSR